MVTAVHKLQGAGGFGGADSYWIATAGTSDDEYGSGVSVMSDNSIAVVGFNNTTQDAYVLKYSTDGDVIWSKRFGTSGESLYQGRQVAVDSSDNIIVPLTSVTYGSANGDLAAVKYDTDGTLQWQKAWASSSIESCFGAAVSSTGNYYICGETRVGGGNENAILIFVDSSGLRYNTVCLQSSDSDYFDAVAVDSSDNAIVTGTTVNGAGFLNVLLAKYNSSGVLQWQRNLGSASFILWARCIAVDASDNIYIAGQSDVAFVAKYNSSGTLQWFRKSSPTSMLYGITVDSSGNIYCAGYKASPALGSAYTALVIKYDNSGNILWANEIGNSSAATYGRQIALDQNENIILSANTAAVGAGAQDLMVAKLPSDGSGLGVYGGFTYRDATADLTPSAPSVTAQTATLSEIFVSLTTYNTFFADGTATLTETLETI